MTNTWRKTKTKTDKEGDEGHKGHEGGPICLCINIPTSEQCQLLYGKLYMAMIKCYIFMLMQGGRTWQPFVGGKKGHESFCQARIYNFRDKCVVIARNRKFTN